MRDVLDVQVAAADEHLQFDVQRGGEHRMLRARRRYGQALGLDFETPTFDGIRRCANRCEFCFLAQMPPGLRRSLYVRDDDYRLSFLHGSYITLTNLAQADWQRIADQHLSPLYVSVQATELALRRELLGNPGAPDVLEQLGRLGELGIEVHAQLVLAPGVNDGPHLQRSLDDLAGLYPGVRSVSVVPVGLTRFHRGGCRAHSAAELRAAVDSVKAFQAWARTGLGATFAHLSDEWYLRLGEEVPPLDDYDGLDLTENGVGLVRRFLDQDTPLERLWGGAQPATLVTGTLFAPLLRRCTQHLPVIEVVAVENRFLGPSVTVAGLLVGQDVVAALADRGRREPVVLPAAMFGGPAGQTLDEMLPAHLEEQLGRPVVVAPAMPSVAAE
jgi:putative radical SAM enzyme (TIGR03279 family)